MTIKLTVRCVSCKHERLFRPDEDADLGPMCEKCFSPMVAVRAQGVLDPKSRHGSTCPKEPHDDPNGGYLHGPDDDSPYDVDHLKYCGRCHRALAS